MNELERQRIINDYLSRLDKALAGKPASERRELIEDVRGHIEEAWESSEDRSLTTLLNILERLGPPEAFADDEAASEANQQPTQVVVSSNFIADGFSTIATRLAIMIVVVLAISIVASNAVSAGVLGALFAAVAIWGYRHRHNLGLGWVILPSAFAAIMWLITIYQLTGMN